MTGFDLIVAAFAALFGLVVGSFLNVVIYRLPRGESVAWPGSRCPLCGSPIRWYHNLPVVSWILLRGACRDCGGAITRRYPMVEALTGVAFLSAALLVGPGARLLLIVAFLAALIAITFIDLDHHIIPDRIVLPGALIALAASVALEPGRWWVYLVASLGAATFLMLLGLIWAGGMGFGDVKLGLMMGGVLGSSVIVALFLAFLVGGIAGVLAIAAGRKGRRDKMAFGPFLAVGSVVAALWGPVMLDAYLRLL